MKIACPVCDGCGYLEQPGADPSVETPCWCCGGIGEIPDRAAEEYQR